MKRVFGGVRVRTAVIVGKADYFMSRSLDISLKRVALLGLFIGFVERRNRGGMQRGG